MTERSKLFDVSTAIAALLTPALGVATSAHATAIEPSHDEAMGLQPAPKLTVRVGGDFMKFTVSDNPRGVVVADHESHASHASHESHASHASHASGM